MYKESWNPKFSYNIRIFKATKPGERWTPYIKHKWTTLPALVQLLINASKKYSVRSFYGKTCWISIFIQLIVTKCFNLSKQWQSLTKSWQQNSLTCCNKIGWKKITSQLVLQFLVTFLFNYTFCCIDKCIVAFSG